MSISIPFAGRREKPAKPRRKHRADDRIAELHQRIAELCADAVKLLNRQAAADDFFAILWHDVVTTNGALGQEKQARGDAEEAAARLRMERDDWRDKALALQARFGPQIAAEENANRIDVPPMVRDTSDPRDQATGPINVTALWEAHEAGLLGPVTDPGHAAT